MTNKQNLESWNKREGTQITKADIKLRGSGDEVAQCLIKRPHFKPR